MGEDAGLVVNRWRRYGNDRLYVEFPDGTKVGYWDLLADTGHPASPEHHSVLLRAVADWHAGRPPEKPAASVPSDPGAEPSALADKPADPDGSPDPEDTREPQRVIASATGDLPSVRPVEEPPRPWIDLATNHAGEAAREQALAARDAAPVRTVLARVLGVKTDERSWRVGADGEEKVAAKIEKVIRKNPRWRVLHAIPVGNRGSDIDHLVVGPGGVFTINTKHHPGAKIWVGGSTFMVDGHKQPYIRNSRYEADRASKLLTAATGTPVHVEGLIVTVNADDIVIKTPPVGVYVVPRMQIARWLLRLGPVLSDDQIDTVYQAARRSTTWRP